MISAISGSDSTKDFSSIWTEACVSRRNHWKCSVQPGQHTYLLVSRRQGIAGGAHGTHFVGSCGVEVYDRNEGFGKSKCSWGEESYKETRLSLLAGGNFFRSRRGGKMSPSFQLQNSESY